MLLKIALTGAVLLGALGFGNSPKAEAQGYYPPPYYYDHYPYYWYPDYYYYDYHPYVRPSGSWRTFDSAVKRLEKNIDNLKDVADNTAVESLVKQADKAVDNLNDELNYYGTYSPSHIEDLVENLNHHMNALQNGVGRNQRVANAFTSTWSLLESVNTAFERVRP